jgi:hypothetical protein
MRTVWVLMGLMAISATAWAAPPMASSSDGSPATASIAARRNAVQSIPFDQLDDDARQKVDSILSNITVYRRLPVRTVNCDPDLYLFLVRHPDVVVNMWEVLGIAQLQLRETGPNAWRIVEKEGTAAMLQLLYRSNDLHIVYSEWTYTGPLLQRKINGRCLAILRTTYSRDEEGRYNITSRLDGFMHVDSGSGELLTKTLLPLVVKNADTNFIQTLAFVGSVQHTAEVNGRGMQRFAAKLEHVQPETRQQFAQVVATVSDRAAARTAAEQNLGEAAQLASRPSSDSGR